MKYKNYLVLHYMISSMMQQLNAEDEEFMESEETKNLKTLVP